MTDRPAIEFHCLIVDRYRNLCLINLLVIHPPPTKTRATRFCYSYSVSPSVCVYLSLSLSLSVSLFLNRLAALFLFSFRLRRRRQNPLFFIVASIAYSTVVCQGESLLPTCCDRRPPDIAPSLEIRSLSISRCKTVFGPPRRTPQTVPFYGRITVFSSNGRRARVAGVRDPLQYRVQRVAYLLVATYQPPALPPFIVSENLSSIVVFYHISVTAFIYLELFSPLIRRNRPKFSGTALFEAGKYLRNRFMT